MIFLKILKYLSLAFAIAYTYTNTFRVLKSQRVSMFQSMAMSVSIAVYIALEFDLGF